MAKFYFTYGSDPAYPFCGGWTEIEATSLYQATNIFKAAHRNDIDSETLNCADYYTEEGFKKQGCISPATEASSAMKKSNLSAWTQ